MSFSTKILSQTITQLCLAKGIDHIVISPGSRSAPLTIGFNENDAFHCFSIVDERCAAFFALGMAQQLKRPVALVCTSGSALLNYYPAVAEAFYSDIPLVVLSADRPADLIDVGDGQTIRQEHVYANHIAFEANLKEGEPYTSENVRLVNEALNTSIQMMAPVHINIPFSEPLYGTQDQPMLVPENIAVPAIHTALDEDLTPFIQQWNQAERKMILVGVCPPHSLEEQLLDQLVSDPSVIVFTETTSNLHHDEMFPAIDQMIAPLDDEGFQQLQPQILVTFGGMIVSKKIKAFLRKYQPQAHWHIDPKTAYDTFFALKHHFKTNPTIFFETFLAQTQVVPSNYQEYWNQVRHHRLARHEHYVQQIQYSDFKVFSHLFASIPNGYQLHLANSATVRYAQLFDLHTSLEVFCNRGTSGIDGSTSTAIGGAYASQRPSVFITGDLSFFYDSNALWNTYIPKDFRIIIVNNSGGGIFRILPGAKQSKNFETYFETQHQLNAQPLAELYGFSYQRASDEASLLQELETFFQPSEAPAILEVFTPARINDEVLLSYFDFIS